MTVTFRRIETRSGRGTSALCSGTKRQVLQEPQWVKAHTFAKATACLGARAVTDIWRTVFTVAVLALPCIRTSRHENCSIVRLSELKREFALCVAIIPAEAIFVAMFREMSDLYSTVTCSPLHALVRQRLQRLDSFGMLAGRDHILRNRK